MAAKPSIRAYRFGPPPDPKIPVQTYPGISTKYDPQEALLIYTNKLEAERAAYVDNPRKRHWFRDHRDRMRKEEATLSAYNAIAMKSSQSEGNLPRLGYEGMRKLDGNINSLIKLQCSPHNKHLDLL
eukprot:gnl/TRDRNA2_/TRDRNA2_189397_c0_seq1.p1 gnl/TRDRNA2_/TRDRNA2_189397_c0~~gnl/TRDRNA2_/TRDRNA2_189397_c0_seq1.p1  ORF type:complete len:127 (+),score=15.72 gnl/TRDRNA2_/TRDRNA2_189397_c0_seq1:61-441(+)